MSTLRPLHPELWSFKALKFVVLPGTELTLGSDLQQRLHPCFRQL
jgi:hypothetical protein